MKLETVGPLETLPEGEGFLFKSGAHQIALFRDGDMVHAIDDVCPHAGASLCSGYSDGKVVACPWHGWEFEVASGKGRSVEGVDADTFPVVIENGIVKVELPD